MSRAAGTLITTKDADYMPPYLMPGYRGHCPTIKFDYGETNGNCTSKYFQDYRSSVLNSSQSCYSQGGRFPTYYTHNPDLVMSQRSRSWDQFLHTPRYKLNHSNEGRKEDLESFFQSTQAHREQYSDRSRTLRPLKYFILPATSQEHFIRNSCVMKFFRSIKVDCKQLKGLLLTDRKTFLQSETPNVIKIIASRKLKDTMGVLTLINGMNYQQPVYIDRSLKVKEADNFSELK